MKLSWLGHSCFLLESGGFTAILDPYREVPGLPDVKAQANAIYCSHEHFDHAYREGVRLLPGKGNPFTVREIQSFHDTKQGALRGENTIRVFSAEGVTLAHLGDLGHLLSEEQLHEIGRVDVLLLPVGGTYTLDAKGARAVAEVLSPRVIVPMHYRSGKVGFPELSTLEDFTKLYPESLLHHYESNTLSLTPDLSQQIAILSLPQ